MKEGIIYEIKKIIASLMALSIIGSSGLVFGGTVKAATLNNISNVEMTVGDQLNSNINLSGNIYWSQVKNARSYEVVVKTSKGTQILSFGGGTDYLFQHVSEYVNPNGGSYIAQVSARDSNGKVIASEQFSFDYNGRGLYTSYKH